VLACVARVPRDVRIGQTMLVTTTGLPRVQGWLDDGLIAGILANGTLTPATAAALDEATSANAYGALLAADEEGGGVQRYRDVVAGLPSAQRQAATMTPAEEGPARLAPVLLTCLALTFLNPHVYLDTVVLLGTLANEQGDGRWLFGAGAVTASIVWFFGLGFGARRLAGLFARPGTWRVLDVVIAAVMITLGVSLALA
jgi:hypothetical protein